MHFNVYERAGHLAPESSGRLGKSAILVSRKRARIPGRADFSLLAVREGWKAFEGSWDSDNFTPTVAAFEAAEVAVVIVGAVPKIEGERIDRLFLRRGIRVVLVAHGEAPETDDDAAAWVLGATSLEVSRPPLGDDGLTHLDSFEPTAILSAISQPAA